MWYIILNTFVLFTNERVGKVQGNGKEVIPGSQRCQLLILRCILIFYANRYALIVSPS